MDIFSLLAIGQLWSLSFADGSVLNGTMYTSVFTNASGAVVYRVPSADVEIASRSIKDGVEVKGKVTVRSGVVTDFMLPARMTFSPDDVERVSFPGNKWMGTGYSLKDDFSRPRFKDGKFSYENGVFKGRDFYRGMEVFLHAELSSLPLSVRSQGNAMALHGHIFGMFSMHCLNWWKC